MKIPTSTRRYLRATLALLIALVAVVAIISGMAHAVGALRVAAARPTAAVVPTLAPISHINAGSVAIPACGTGDADRQCGGRAGDAQGSRRLLAGIHLRGQRTLSGRGLQGHAL
ncbi:MAG TPA: hypothetical protein VH393_08325, partial [Ktedonobacterales bacterium]